ncbi:hypothetical protein ACIOWM_14000 [Streptomyces anulatus]
MTGTWRGKGDRGDLLFFSIGPDAAFDPGPVLGFLSRVTGAALLCTSVHRTAVQKTTGVLLAVVVPTTAIVSWNVISGWAAGEMQALLGNLGSLALMVGTAVWLWRTRRA